MCSVKNINQFLPFGFELQELYFFFSLKNKPTPLTVSNSFCNGFRHLSIIDIIIS
jgi:hypothetical protein